MPKKDTRSGCTQCKIPLTRVLHARANYNAVIRGGIPGIFVSYVSRILNRVMISISILIKVGHLTNESNQS